MKHPTAQIIQPTAQITQPIIMIQIIQMIQMVQITQPTTKQITQQIIKLTIKPIIPQIIQQIITPRIKPIKVYVRRLSFLFPINANNAPGTAKNVMLILVPNACLIILFWILNVVDALLDVSSVIQRHNVLCVGKVTY